MARDLDFRRKPTSTQTVQPNKGQTTPPIQSNTTPRKNRRRGLAPLVIAIIGLAAAATGAYYWATLPPTQKTTDTSSQTTTVAPPADDQKNVFQANKELVVNVYQSGAAADVIKNVTTVIEEKGFKVENLGDSQFEYDKTYVWHRAEYETQAKAIGQALSGRVVSYKESQNAGLFDILIYLGKQ